MLHILNNARKHCFAIWSARVQLTRRPMLATYGDLCIGHLYLRAGSLQAWSAIYAALDAPSQSAHEGLLVFVPRMNDCVTRPPARTCG